MTGIWDEKPDPSNLKYWDDDVCRYCFDAVEFTQDRDTWLAKVKTLHDRYQIIIAELKETIGNMEDQEKAYRDCIDSLKEKAEKWDKFQDYVIVEFDTEEGSGFFAKPSYKVKSMVDQDCQKKLEAIKTKLIELKKDWRGDRIEDIVLDPLLKILGVEG